MSGKESCSEVKEIHFPFSGMDVLLSSARNKALREEGDFESRSEQNWPNNNLKKNTFI